jgi:hypothetical protein
MTPINTQEWNEKIKKLGRDKFTQREKDFLDSYFPDIQRSPVSAHIKLANNKKNDNSINLSKLNDDWFLMAISYKSSFSICLNSEENFIVVDGYSGLFLIDQFDEFIDFIKSNHIN